jgi:hypothetical protein
MIRKLEADEIGMTGLIDFPLFGAEIESMIEDGASVEYAERCAA